jgi:hypothetical protein
LGHTPTQPPPLLILVVRARQLMAPDAYIVVPPALRISGPVVATNF